MNDWYAVGEVYQFYDEVYLVLETRGRVVDVYRVIDSSFGTFGRSPNDNEASFRSSFRRISP